MQQKLLALPQTNVQMNSYQLVQVDNISMCLSFFFFFYKSWIDSLTLHPIIMGEESSTWAMVHWAI